MTIKTLLGKSSVATLAAGAMAVSATPASANDRYDRDDGIDAGDVIAGALIIGGIAAVAGAIGSRDRDYYDDRRYRDRRYDDRRYSRRGNPRRAVERCVRAAERDARRYGYRYADVTEIRDVDRRNRGWRVRGRMVVDGSRGYRDRYDRRSYGRYDRRGYGRADRGRFTCDIRRGRITDIDYRGIRGLR